MYLKRADELKRASHLASFAIRTFAMQIGMTLRERLTKATDMQFLVVLMDELERERLALGVSPTGEEQEAATRALAIDLYNRAQASDKPDVSHPHPSQKWTIVEAPRVAQAFHASAVLFDALRQFEPTLPPKLEQMQAAAHRRSQQLAAQLSRALTSPPCVPPEWRPFPPSRLIAAKPPAPAPAPVPAPRTLPALPRCGRAPSAGAARSCRRR